MVGLDTNVIVRYLVRDDEAAFQVARDLFRSALAAGARIVICLPVLLECEWVLRSRYQLTKSEILSLFTSLLSAREVVFDDEAVVEYAVHNWRKSTADFADCVIVGACLKAGCTSVATFDRKAAVLPGAILLNG